MTEFDARSVCGELSKALRAGGPTGSPGDLEVGSIETESLQAAIAYAERVGASTGRARTLLDSARAILLIRLGLGAERRVDWGSVQQGLEAAENQPTAPEVEEELDLIRNDVVVRGISEDLRQALASGGPTERRVGGRGAGEAVVLDTSSVTVVGLDDAIASFEGLDDGTAPEELALAIRAARGVRAVRAALLDGDWDEAEEAAAACVRMESGSESSAEAGGQGKGSKLGDTLHGGGESTPTSS